MLSGNKSLPIRVPNQGYRDDLYRSSNEVAFDDPIIAAAPIFKKLNKETIYGQPGNRS